MPDDQQQRDIDFLLEFREFKGVVNTKLDRALNDIQDLKDGTSTKIASHDKRIDELEKEIKNRVDWKTFNVVSAKVDSNDTYNKLLIAIGLLLVGMFIFHLTGYSF